MSSDRFNYYSSFIESSFWRYYNGTLETLHGVSLEASKAASSAWKTWVSSESWRPVHTTPSLIGRPMNGGKAVRSTFSFASRSLGAFRDLTSFRFSRVNTNIRQLPTSPIHHAKAAALTPTDPENETPDIDPLVLSTTAHRQLNKYEASSMLSMGLLYMLRDLALKEAFDLLESLRFWLERWENPILSFVEAGPFVWFSPLGYHHKILVGDKIADIQGHLSKLSVTIGELQQQIIRAGRKVNAIPQDTSPINKWLILGDAGIECEEADCVRQSLLKVYPKVQESQRPLFYSSTDFIISNALGNVIERDEVTPNEWTAQSMTLIRNHLYKIYRLDSNDNAVPLSTDSKNERHSFLLFDNESNDVPSWTVDESIKEQPCDKVSVGFTFHDLRSFTKEVDYLVDNMVFLHNQQVHRFHYLKPPTRIARNWYVLVLGLPLASYSIYYIIKEQMNSKLLPEIFNKIFAFSEEHIFDPMRSIYRELFTRKGREDVTDRQARYHTMEILRKMIQSWVIDTYPNMSNQEVTDMVHQMDISLIEQKKEESIKNILELNNIIRMSMIEMQFIKKELMNALYSIDELMGSNEINVKLAAMTPAFLLFSSVRYVFRYLFYALLKLGRSKEQTYESIRLIILDLERLLTLRNNTLNSPDADKHVLAPEDLGLFTLLIHECRHILLQSQRRFSTHDLKNISEDLSELSGERGAVSIRQQLQIISRMARTYSFLTAR